MTMTMQSTLAMQLHYRVEGELVHNSIVTRRDTATAYTTNKRCARRKLSKIGAQVRCHCTFFCRWCIFECEMAGGCYILGADKINIHLLTNLVVRSRRGRRCFTNLPKDNSSMRCFLRIVFAQSGRVFLFAPLVLLFLPPPREKMRARAAATQSSDCVLSANGRLSRRLFLLTALLTLSVVVLLSSRAASSKHLCLLASYSLHRLAPDCHRRVN